MKRTFYPLGTVVVLQGGNKKVMIIGRLQLREKDQAIFDYGACYYPEGLLDSEQIFLFNHTDIKEVIFMGFQDEEEKQLQDYIQMRCEELNI